MRKTALLAAAALLLFAAPATRAAEPTVEERLAELEKAYVELLVSDRNKSRELERLRGELEALGAQPAVATGRVEDHQHEHEHEHGQGHEQEHAGHGHAHGSHDPLGIGDLLVETGSFRLYTPSIGLDLVGYGDSSDPALEARLGELRGFGGGHDHEHDDDDHAHGQLDHGFNLRHAEIGLAAEIIGFGQAQILLNASLDGVELEEAFFKSAPIGDLATIKLGKFRSGFGFFNAQHSPEWDFADAPLAHYTLLGDHGLEDLGAQLVLAPAALPVEFGLEVLQGDGETLFTRDEAAGDAMTPGAAVAWARARVLDEAGHHLVVGLAGGLGVHQQALGGHEGEEHEEEEHEEEEQGHAEELGDGTAWFFSPGFAYLRQGKGARGQGDLRVTGEYLLRGLDMDVVGEDERYRSLQDGYYLQAVYGVAPGLDLGLRWEQLGLVNRVEAEGDTADFGSSWRASGLLAYRFNGWARAGVQIGYGAYDFEAGRDEVFQALARFTIQLGPHLH